MVIVMFIVAVGHGRLETPTHSLAWVPRPYQALEIAARACSEPPVALELAARACSEPPVALEIAARAR